MYGREFHEWRESRNLDLRRARCCEDAAEQYMAHALENISEAKRMLDAASLYRSPLAITGRRFPGNVF